MLCQQAAHARPKPTSLQIRTNVNLYNMHSRPKWSSVLTRFFWALAYQFFCLFVVCGASVTLDADWIVLCSISSCPVLRLLSPLPLGGGGRNKRTKKKVWGNECALGPFEPSWCFNVSVKEHTHSLLVSYPLLCCPKKKKGRMTTHASYICYAASRWLRPCLLLLPSGALFADRDGLSTAVSAFGRFLRSIYLFCINFFLIQPFLYSGS